MFFDQRVQPEEGNDKHDKRDAGGAYDPFTCSGDMVYI